MLFLFPSPQSLLSLLSGEVSLFLLLHSLLLEGFRKLIEAAKGKAVKGSGKGRADLFDCTKSASAKYG